MKKFYKDVLILISLLFISILISNIHTRPFWDWFSYHYYNGWALLNSRIDIDIMPGLYRTYYNPVLDALNYLFVNSLNNHPYLITYISELKYGIFLFLSYKIFDLVFQPDIKNRTFLLLFCLLMTGLSPFIFVLKGFEYTDLQVAILIMLGLFILLKNLNFDCYKNKVLMFFISGFIVGLGFGLKYTCIIFFPAIFLIFLLKYKSLNHPVKILILYGFAIFCGFLLTNGFWFYTLWNKFHNPFFPYFNEIFKSPYADFVKIIDTDYYHVKPHNFIDFILFPFSKKGFEFEYFDLKLRLTFLCSIIILLFSCIFKNSFKKIQEYINIDIFYSLMIFTIVPFYMNCLILGQIRYICPSFGTSAIITTVAFMYLCGFSAKKYIPILCFLLIAQSSTMYIKGLLYPWSYKPKKFIEIPDLKFEDNSIVLCACYTTAYLIPKQNPKAQYIGFTIPKKVKEEQGGFYDAFFKNLYYTSDYLEDVIAKKFEENNNIYLILSKDGLAYDKADFPLYNSAVEYYSKGENNIEMSKYVQVPIIISGYNEKISPFNYSPGPYYVYKLKTHKP